MINNQTKEETIKNKPKTDECVKVSVQTHIKIKDLTSGSVIVNKRG